jgi:hypothetical protein
MNNYKDIKNLRLSATPAGTSIRFKFRYLSADYNFTVYHYEEVQNSYSSFGYEVVKRRLDPIYFRKAWEDFFVPELEKFLQTGAIERNRKRTLTKLYRKKMDALIQECLKVGIEKDEISQMVDENLAKSIVES